MAHTKRGVLLPFFHTMYENRLHKPAYYQTLDPLISFANQPGRRVALLHWRNNMGDLYYDALVDLLKLLAKK